LGDSSEKNLSNRNRNHGKTGQEQEEQRYSRRGDGKSLSEDTYLIEYIDRARRFDYARRISEANLGGKGGKITIKKETLAHVHPLAFVAALCFGLGLGLLLALNLPNLNRVT
jgi:hypothetical protein